MRVIDDLPLPARSRFPYRSRFASVNGWRMHYIDEGPADARAVLLLHGNPTWGFLWRDVIGPLLTAGHRVIVPDQIGFGLSEKPRTHGVHTLDNHIANVVALLDALDLRDVVLGCHDWGGPTGLGAVLTRPHRVTAVAVMSTWAWVTPSSDFHQGVLPWRLMHAPLVGPYLMGRHAAMPGRGMYLSVVDRARFASEAEDVYAAVLGDPDDRALTWTWPRSIPLGRPTDIANDRFTWLEEGVRSLRLPATVIWGREDDVFPADVFAAHWHEVWPHAEGTHLVTGKHFLQEDSGVEIGRLLVEFAARVGAAGGAR
jgi:pimeloyl-ACP methyl ester carboxylesterase